MSSSQCGSSALPPLVKTSPIVQDQFRFWGDAVATAPVELMPRQMCVGLLLHRAEGIVLLRMDSVSCCCRRRQRRQCKRSAEARMLLMGMEEEALVTSCDGSCVQGSCPTLSRPLRRLNLTCQTPIAIVQQARAGVPRRRRPLTADRAPSRCLNLTCQTPIALVRQARAGIPRRRRPLTADRGPRDPHRLVRKWWRLSVSSARVPELCEAPRAWQGAAPFPRIGGLGICDRSTDRPRSRT